MMLTAQEQEVTELTVIPQRPTINMGIKQEVSKPIQTAQLPNITNME